MNSISIISKDAILLRQLSIALNAATFYVRIFSAWEADAIADIMIIDEDKLGLTRAQSRKLIHQLSEQAIVIVVASNIDVKSKVDILDLGADDHLKKPIHDEEVLARINAVKRRMEAGLTIKTSAGDLILNKTHRIATVNDHILDLTKHEFSVLLSLVESKGGAVSRADLMDGIWGYHDMGKTRPIDNLIKRLRKKLLDAGSQLTIKVAWGYGYQLLESEASDE